MLFLQEAEGKLTPTGLRQLWDFLYTFLEIWLDIFNCDPLINSISHEISFEGQHSCLSCLLDKRPFPKHICLLNFLLEGSECIFTHDLLSLILRYYLLGMVPTSYLNFEDHGFKVECLWKDLPMYLNDCFLVCYILNYLTKSPSMKCNIGIVLVRVGSGSLGKIQLCSLAELAHTLVPAEDSVMDGFSHAGLSNVMWCSKGFISAGGKRKCFINMLERSFWSLCRWKNCDLIG